MKLSLLSQFWLPILVLLSTITAKAVPISDEEADAVAAASPHHLAKRAWTANNRAYLNGYSGLLSKRGWNSQNQAYLNGFGSLLAKRDAADAEIMNELEKRGWNSGNRAYNMGMSSLLSKRGWNNANKAYNMGYSSLLSKRSMEDEDFMY